MAPHDHIEAAKVAAQALAQNLTQQSRAAVVQHWAGHIIAFLKGGS